MNEAGSTFDHCSILGCKPDLHVEGGLALCLHEIDDTKHHEKLARATITTSILTNMVRTTQNDKEHAQKNLVGFMSD